ncbi:MAG: hypothetical protein ABR976_22285 [Terracidiphilus sp.]|jgi:hypothetical protein
MISKRSFIGIPLATRRSRRWFVVGYWAVTLSLVGAAFLWVGPNDPDIALHSWWLFLLISGLAGILGGTRENGIVREFKGGASGQDAPPNYSFMTAEDIAAKQKAARESRLDERDVNLRNAIHFRAYAFIRGNALIVALALTVLTYPRSHLSGLDYLSAALLWLLLLVFLGLPQSMILWSEPDMEEAQ